MHGATSLPLLLLSLVSFLLILPQPSLGIKFSLQAFRYPPTKCIWNAAHPNTLVIVTANVGPNESQRMDIEIVDSSPQKNVYLSKRDIKGESRLAVTTHGEGEVGVCFKNHIVGGGWGRCRVLSMDGWSPWSTSVEVVVVVCR